MRTHSSLGLGYCSFSSERGTEARLPAYRRSLGRRLNRETRRKRKLCGVQWTEEMIIIIISLSLLFALYYLADESMLAGQTSISRKKTEQNITPYHVLLMPISLPIHHFNTRHLTILFACENAGFCSAQCITHISPPKYITKIFINKSIGTYGTNRLSKRSTSKGL